MPEVVVVLYLYACHKHHPSLQLSFGDGRGMAFCINVFLVLLRTSKMANTDTEAICKLIPHKYETASLKGNHFAASCVQKHHGTCWLSGSGKRLAD